MLGDSLIGLFFLPPLVPPWARHRAVHFRHVISLGAWVAQSVKCVTSAQVMILWLVTSSSASGLCADSAEPGACFRFCVSLYLWLSPPKKKNIKKNF